MQNLDFHLGELFIAHRPIASSEIYRPCQNLTDSAAATDGLVVDLHVGMQLVIFAEPLGIDWIRKRSARPIQSGLPEGWERQGKTQQRYATNQVVLLKL